MKDIFDKGVDKIDASMARRRILKGYRTKINLTISYRTKSNELESNLDQMSEAELIAFDCTLDEHWISI